FGGVLSKAGDPIPGGGTVAQGKSASFFSGGSLHMHLEAPNKDGGINPSGIVQLAHIDVTKIVDSGSAAPEQGCFNISPNPNNIALPLCPASGGNSVTFSALNTGSYTITETNLAGYSFASGSGTNCTFNAGMATAVVTAAAPNATNASCTFHNAIQAAHLVVC